MWQESGFTNAARLYAAPSPAPAEGRGSISPHQWVRMLVPDTAMEETDEMEEFYEDEMEEFMDEDDFDEME